jgi:hypothetical protein
MNTAVIDLAARAKTLPPSDRANLIEVLLESLLHTDDDVVKAWAVEAESRVDAMARGELLVVDEPEVLAKFRARLA